MSVLLGNELGLGLGYSLQIREIASQLNIRGCRPIVAVRSLDSVYRLFKDSEFQVIQAPFVTGRLPAEMIEHGFYPNGFADLMACNGFGSVDHLYSMVRGWRDLIDLVKPKLVVANYAPLLTLAAFGRIPVVLFGTSYLTPPVEDDFFPGLPNREFCNRSQAEMLERVARVQRLFGAPIPSRLTDVYRGSRRVIVSLPELDPYQEFRCEPYEGLFETVVPPEPIAPGEADDFYAYLVDDDRLTETMLTNLLRSRLTGSIYVRDEHLRRSAGSGSQRIRILDDLPSLSDITRRSAVIVHHGGLGTTQASLAAGRPQFLAPRLLDQCLTASALAEMPYVDVADNRDGLFDMEARIRRLRDDRGGGHAAMDFAHSIQHRGLHGAAQRVIDNCLELCVDL